MDARESRERTVAVSTHSRGEGRKPLYLAYLRDYSPTWPGLCFHRVMAKTGADAKWMAIESHKQGVGCSSHA